MSSSKFTYVDQKEQQFRDAVEAARDEVSATASFLYNLQNIAIEKLKKKNRKVKKADYELLNKLKNGQFN